MDYKTQNRTLKQSGADYHKIIESNKRRAGEKRNNKGYMGNTNSGRSVICINNSKTYISIAQAARELGVNKRSIHTVLSGRYKSVKGYSFRYL